QNFIINSRQLDRSRDPQSVYRAIGALTTIRSGARRLIGGGVKSRKGRCNDHLSPTSRTCTRVPAATSRQVGDGKKPLTEMALFAQDHFQLAPAWDGRLRPSALFRAKPSLGMVAGVAQW